MEFDWDEVNSLVNLAKHGVDIAKATEMFDGRPRFDRASDRDAERRFATTAKLDNVRFTAIWTERSGKLRLISVRRARDAERRNYRLLHE